MNLVIFGLTMSSAWGNGHATLWRGLCRALHERGNRVTFFERDVPYYASHRDMTDPAWCDLRLYSDWSDVVTVAHRSASEADVAIVTSYCPDARAASRVILESSGPLKVFYDLDTPVTLSRLAEDGQIDYLPERGLGAFDLVLSYTGGPALDALRQRLGARAVAPLYGSVDPLCHRPVDVDPSRRADFSYLGTYSADRQDALDRFFLEPARRRPHLRFTLAGSQYPDTFPWPPNIFYLSHMPPHDHASFFSSSALTLNVTRGPMKEMGFCPSGRLFEAAACGTPLLTDWWQGLDEFFEPGTEILVATTTDDVTSALDLGSQDLAAIASAARARTLDCHTAAHRAATLEELVEIACSRPVPQVATNDETMAAGVPSGKQVM
jgi:spore maturation protein CgeB